MVKTNSSKLMKKRNNKTQSHNYKPYIYWSILFIVGWSLFGAAFNLDDNLRCWLSTNNACSADIPAYSLQVLPLWIASFIIGYAVIAQYRKNQVLRIVVAVALSFMIGYLALWLYGVVLFGFR